MGFWSTIGKWAVSAGKFGVEHSGEIAEVAGAMTDARRATAEIQSIEALKADYDEKIKKLETNINEANGKINELKKSLNYQAAQCAIATRRANWACFLSVVCLGVLAYLHFF